MMTTEGTIALINAKNAQTLADAKEKPGCYHSSVYACIADSERAIARGALATAQMWALSAAEYVYGRFDARSQSL